MVAVASRSGPSPAAASDSVPSKERLAGNLVPAELAQTALIGSDFDLLVVALTVHYRIKSVAQYGYGSKCYKDPHGLLEAFSYRETVQYAAHSNLEALLGPGRHKTTAALQNAIQAVADKFELGVSIVFVGLESVHPPIAIADSFEQVISSLQEKQAKVLSARGAARELLAIARGQDAIRRSEAEAYAYRRSRLAEADAERFSSQQEAFAQGGQVYQWREYLSVLDETLPDNRKYVIASSKVNRWVYELDLKEKLQPDLFEGLGIPEKK